MNEITKVPEESKITASMKLVAAREAMGMSQEDVAGALYLKIAFIRHIDEDELHKISKQAFIKGYLRSYAKLVNLDDDEVVKLYSAQSDPSEDHVEFRGVTDRAVGSKNFTGPILQTGIFGLLALTIVVALVWYYSSGSEEPTSALESSTPATQSGSSSPEEEITSGAATTDQPATTPSEERPAEEPAAETLSPGEARSEVPDFEGLTDTAPARINLVQNDNLGTESNDFETLKLAEINLINTDLMLIQRETIDGLRYITITGIGNASGADNLRFVFTDDCWLEVTDANRNRMFMDLGRPGNILLVKGKAPFEVLFGKTTGVTMEFNGVSFDLARYTSSDDTAKVTAG